MRNRQEGQALVVVMVVMLLVFALAGAVAIGASTLRSQEAQTSSAFTDDFIAESAATDAVAQVLAGQPCSTPSSQPAKLQILLPSQTSDTNKSATAYCTRLDGVAVSPAVRPLDVLWQAGQQPACASVDLTTTLSGKVWIFFQARADSGAAWAFVDNKQDCPSPSSLPSACQTGQASSGCLCSADLGKQSPVAQAALKCDFGQSNKAQPYLHIQNPARSPRLAFSVLQDSTSGGTLYMLLAGTGLRPRADYEEATIFMSRDGASKQLRYEARLP